MKVVVLSRPNSEHSQIIFEFVRDFQSRTGGTYPVELIDVDSRQGGDLAKLYDIVQYPAILVTDGSGAMQQSWQGDSLPLIDEVTAYCRA